MLRLVPWRLPAPGLSCCSHPTLYDSMLFALPVYTLVFCPPAHCALICDSMQPSYNVKQNYLHEHYRAGQEGQVCELVAESLAKSKVWRACMQRGPHAACSSQPILDSLGPPLGAGKYNCQL